jgi:Tfp pilus assembly protein PilF
MRVAQAQHRRGHLATAADWARKALALDANIPEAFVIVARAELGADHDRAADDDYRRYLALAPRGWHAAEARRALRAER